jgi:hypothetical protein
VNRFEFEQFGAADAGVAQGGEQGVLELIPARCGLGVGEVLGVVEDGVGLGWGVVGAFDRYPARGPDVIEGAGTLVADVL